MLYRRRTIIIFRLLCWCYYVHDNEGDSAMYDFNTFTFSEVATIIYMPSIYD